MITTEIIEALKHAIVIIESKEQPKEKKEKKLTKREEIENYKKLLR
jgi:hypothetical protein